MTDRYPENNSSTLYIRSSGVTFGELRDRIEEHFNTQDIDAFVIDSEKIHTRCITYDLYDGADYDDYLIIRKV